MRRWALALVVIASGAAAAIALGRVPTDPHSARQVAHRILASAQVPPGAQESAGDPSGSKLAKPGTYPLTPDLVDLHRFWRVPGDLQTVFDWIESHPPAGTVSRQGGGTATSGGGEVSAYDGFSLVRPRRGAPSEVLLFTGVPARGGGTALRVDAQVVWLFKRPASERVPGGADAIRVSDRRTDGTRSAWSIIESARIRRAVAIINALPAGQPGVTSCPGASGSFVTLVFMRRGHRLATAKVDGGDCEAVNLWIRARRQNYLQGDPQLIDRLSSALGVAL